MAGRGGESQPPEEALRRQQMAQVADLYLRTRVLTAEPLRLVIELHDAAIRSLEQALRALAGRREAGRHVSQVIHILGELDLFLDFRREEELAQSMGDLYEHLQSILATECASPSQIMLQEVLEHFRTLRESWWVIRGQR